MADPLQYQGLELRAWEGYKQGREERLRAVRARTDIRPKHYETAGSAGHAV
jgi:hypothetical protein